MSDPVDPTDLAPDAKPSVVHTEDGELFVASADSTENGWLWYLKWDGQVGHMPPGLLIPPGVVRLPTTRDDTPGPRSRRLESDDLVDRAVRNGGRMDE